MKHPALLCLFALVLLPTAGAQIPAAPNRANPLRSFDEIFPGIGESRKREIFGHDGLTRSVKRNEALEFIPAPGAGIDLLDGILKSNPSFLTESLLVIPYQGQAPGAGNAPDRLDIHNALRNIRDLKGRLYRSHTRNAEVPLFEDATRIESAQKTTPIPDPLPVRALPPSETIYLRLKDVNFGNSYYRREMIVNPHGISHNFTNVRNLSYLLFTVMKEEKFSAALYLEPLAEGMLIYSMAGADASDFISNRIDIPSAIEKRLAVFIGWISDGIKAVR